MDPAIKAVAMIAPVLAPLAVKIIDKLIFEENQPKQQQQQIQGPQIIQVAAPQQCNCRKNRAQTTIGYYDDSSTSCSTCTTCSTCYPSTEQTRAFQDVSNKSSCFLMPGPQKIRSSSMSEKSSSLYTDVEKSKQKSLYTGHSKSSSDIRSSTEPKKSRNDDTLEILAHRLNKEIKKETGSKKNLAISKGKENIKPCFQSCKSELSSKSSGTKTTSSRTTRKITTSNVTKDSKKSGSCCRC